MRRPVRSIRLAYHTEPLLEEYLGIAFIQTILDKEAAWLRPYPSLTMKTTIQSKVWQDIRRGFSSLKNDAFPPHIVVLPELTVPRGYLNSLKNLCGAVGAVVIAGLDFNVGNTGEVRNQGVILVPQNWPDRSLKSKGVSHIYFGKTFPSEDEKDLIGGVARRNLSVRYSFIPDPSMYILYAGKYGIIGIAICSDFYDVERFVIYKGKIHHMIVIAHNKDIDSFYFLAEAISRLVYCNVIVCNTGYYGDSLAFSPYRETYKRIVYRHGGQNLFNMQVVKVPVLELDKAQGGNDPNKQFKSRPPGYVRQP